MKPANRCSSVWMPFSGRISWLGTQKRRSNTVMSSPFGVRMFLATRTAGACMRVWSTVKLSSRGMAVPFVCWNGEGGIIPLPFVA